MDETALFYLTGQRVAWVRKNLTDEITKSLCHDCRFYEDCDEIAECTEKARGITDDLLRATPSILDPGNAVKRHTGTWRVERPVIDRSVCSRCGLCVVRCPDGAVELDVDGEAVVGRHVDCGFANDTGSGGAASSLGLPQRAAGRQIDGEQFRRGFGHHDKQRLCNGRGEAEAA